ncbi:MAG: endonuclease/exonuclease/phosphatase family protein [Planctomycetota bacterium]|nr:endonuclease/exonuclease/phosphatase family protein [Planctomycetota bacterium]
MFDLVSYNVLADSYIKAEWYPHTDKALLQNKARHKHLLKAITEKNADVYCLQEVELDFVVFLDEQLSPHGYQTFFSAKDHDKPDGCATLIRSKKFEFISQQRWFYEDSLDKDTRNSGHVALILHILFNEKPITIINTHLKWSPPTDDLVQQWSYRQLKHLLSNHRHWRRKNESRVICGDFNLEAESEALQLLIANGFNDAHGNAGEATCFANGGAKRIDYVFHDKDFEVEAHSPMIIPEGTVFPSEDHPSDHLPIGAKFQFKSPSS